MTSEGRPGLELEARAQATGERLLIDYRMHNAADTPLFVFDILHGPFEHDRFPLDPGAYVERAEGQVVVSRKLFAVPDHLLVESVNIPFATRLMPAQAAERRLVLPLPLALRNPYEEEGRQPRAIEGVPMVFELGYFAGADGTEATAVPMPTDHGVLPGFEAFSVERQRLVRTPPLATVPMFVTKDEA